MSDFGSEIGSAIGGAVGGAIGGAMSGFNGLLCDPSGMEEAASRVTQQANVVSQVKDMAEKTVSVVTGGWVGGDADAYAMAIMTQLLPAVALLEAAIADFSGTIGNSLDLFKGADLSVGKEGDALSSLFSSII